MCIYTYSKVQWNFSFSRKWWNMNCWGDKALKMSWFSSNLVEEGERICLPTSGMSQRNIFFLRSSHRKQNVLVEAIPKQAVNELTLQVEAIKLLQTEVTPELIAQVQYYASEATLLQVIVNVPVQGCLTYCSIVFF